MLIEPNIKEIFRKFLELTNNYSDEYIQIKFDIEGNGSIGYYEYFGDGSTPIWEELVTFTHFILN